MDGPSLFYILEPSDREEKQGAALGLISGDSPPALSPSGSHLATLAGAQRSSAIYSGTKR